MYYSDSVGYFVGKDNFDGQETPKKLLISAAVSKDSLQLAGTWLVVGI